MKNNLIVTVLAIFIFSAGCALAGDNTTLPVPADSGPGKKLISMKGVGIDLPQQDFIDMKDAGVEVISTEWGMEQSVGTARAFLDQAQTAGLKVIMDGGFSSTAWGFTDSDWQRLPKGKRPVWQKERVQSWINALKDHPAIYAWDISNEFGENLPSGAGAGCPDWPNSRITVEQLKQARADVLEADPTRPIHARMYGGDVGEFPDHVKAMLDNKIADIISLNLYSNYVSNNKLQWPTVIADAGAFFVEAIKRRQPEVKVWMSLSAFEYPGQFQRTTSEDLERDIAEAVKIQELDGISFFCWGPVDQWDVKGDWYLPRTGPELWTVIKEKFKN